MTKYLIQAHLTEPGNHIEMDSTHCIMNITDSFLGMSLSNWTSTKDNNQNATDPVYDATNDTFKLGVRNTHVHNKVLKLDGTRIYRIIMNHNYRSTRVGVCYNSGGSLTTHYKTPYSFGASTDPSNYYMEYWLYGDGNNIYLKAKSITDGTESVQTLSSITNNEYHFYFYTFTNNETIYSIEEINNNGG